uniref:Uncharacterized protein n=1 Tax=Solanum lycopersicum TaxID=4081 RepID=A0A3Q7IW20_SOLLC
MWEVDAGYQLIDVHTTRQNATVHDQYYLVDVACCFPMTLAPSTHSMAKGFCLWHTLMSP